MGTDLKNKAEQKQANEKPLSLYPLTMDEALRMALDTPPPPKKHDEKKHRKPKAKK